MAKGEESRLARLVRIFVRQLQYAEDAVSDMRNKLILKDAVGAQLDGFGEIVNEPRDGRDDAEYKDALYFRMFLNAGHGEPDLLIEALTRLTQSANVSYTEIHPAKVYMTFDGTIMPTRLAQQMQSLCPAGVDIYVNQGFSDGFIMASETYIPPDEEGLGFDDGKFSGLVVN
jgi:hypothetical protein